MRIILLAILLILAGTAAWAISPSQQIILFGGNSSASNAPAPNGSALLVDGTDAALLIDGTDPACLAGGC